MRTSVLFVLMLLLFYSKNLTAETNSKSVCYLKDRFFIQQVSDIYLNPQDYKNKIIQIEGFFGKYIDENKVEHYSVYRKTAGCCGDDGETGFEFVYKKEKLSFKADDWILVEAHIAKEKDGYDRIYLEAISVTPKKKGNAKEFVY
jgi:uncharacterized membrane protein YcgQ (UPF0703/DUF1980 family)